MPSYGPAMQDKLSLIGDRLEARYGEPGRDAAHRLGQWLSEQ